MSGVRALHVWMNRSYATAVHTLAQLRANPDGVPVTITASHLDPDSPVLTAADEVIAESAATGDAYATYALDTVKARRIDVVWPTWQARAVAAVRDELAELAAAVVSPPADVIDLCADKKAVYDVVAGTAVRVPEHRVVGAGDELRAAFTELRPLGAVCVKPTSGAGGDGFRVLRDGPAGVDELLGPVTPTAAVADVADALDGDRDLQLLVMPVLPGPELSVDVLARDGRLLAAALRRKDDARRRVEIVDDPAALTAVAEVVTAVGLDVIGNVQFRYDSRGHLQLLEVNARASAGLYQAAAAGWNLGWAAVRVARGQEPDLPPPRLPASLIVVPSMVTPLRAT